MTRLNRVAFIGNSLPRRCGIATFTSDLRAAVDERAPDLETAIVAMNDHERRYDYPASVRYQIDDDRLEDYVAIASALNTGGYDVVSLQHEFGIFGGEAGEHVLALLSRLTAPVVTTLHTVLAEPSPAQRKVMRQIVAASARVVVMAEKGRELLRSVYHVPAKKIEVIPHGIPDVAYSEPDAAKAELGFAGRAVILTFGLLSPNKGIEGMIDAMPVILKSRPDAVYVVLGASHPHLVHDEGEVYRERLQARVRELGLEGSVVFLDRFVERAELLRYIEMCDVYVTPYLNEAQMTSGTLAYSFGLGKAVVSTPYWHARELLADGRGLLVPFADSAALGEAIAALLTDPVWLRAMRRRAYASSRSMTWAHTADRYLEVFETVGSERLMKMFALPPQRSPARVGQQLPEIRLAYFQTMCDDTGIAQHAVRSVPDRAHGYCVDDNARALLLACALATPGEQRLTDVQTARFASFIQHAWNPDTRRFRNFMSYDRRWLEDRGSEDSHGRTLWALGEDARHDPDRARRQWAADLFARALPTVEDFAAPRAWAFTLLGLDGYCASVNAPPDVLRLRRILADRLMACLASSESPDHPWFEPGLTYDNARLCQALIVTGAACETKRWTSAGLRTLSWLTTQQTAPSGVFRPVGSDGFANPEAPICAFDQQPLEAAATISACLAAWRIDGAPEWKAEATRAYAWFLGHNDLSIPLVDLDTGSCRDGLHPDRANENRGGESVLSWLLGLAEIRRFARLSEDRKFVAPLRVTHA